MSNIVQVDMCDALRRMASGIPQVSRATEGECRPLITPTYLMRVFLGMTKQFFSTKDRIPFGGVEFFHSEDAEENQIFIGTRYSSDYKHIGSRPAIFLSLENINAERLKGLGTGSKSTAVGINPTNGAVIHNILESTSVIFHCLAGTYLEAWDLAHEVKAFWQTYADVIVEATQKNLAEVFPAGITAPASVEEYKGSFMSVVTINVKYQDFWHVTPETLPVQSFVFDLSPSLP